MNRWSLKDLGTEEVFTFSVNPDEGGSAVPQKSMNITSWVSRNVNGVLQQGTWEPLVIDFSGAILTREQDEAMEAWAMRRVSLELVDDLGRTFVGRLVAFNRERTRRGTNPWFSRYSAKFMVLDFIKPWYDIEEPEEPEEPEE